MRKMIPVIALLLALIMLAGCAITPEDNNKNGESNTDPENSSAIDLSGYTVIAAAGLSKKVRDAIGTFRDLIKSESGLDLPFSYEKAGEDGTGAKEILVGKTAREESVTAYGSIEKFKNTNLYVVKLDKDKIVIAGKNDTGLMLAMRDFIEKAVMPSEKGVIDLSAQGGTLDISEKYKDGDFVFSDLMTVRLELSSVIESNGNKWPTYGRLIELKHNGESNGTLFATSQWAGKTFPIYRSRDKGKNWQLIAEVGEQLKPELIANWQPELYELPVKVGDMPEGTLLLGGCTHDDGTKTTTRMCLWRSFDLGSTWEEFTVVDEGFGLSNGMYEPYMICDENGDLVVFYSDETEVTKNGGQRLVFRVSSDGVNWSETKYCVAPSNSSLRPGMVSVAKMGDKGYMIVYEMIGEQGGPIYYKTSKSLTNWDFKSKGTKIVGSAGEFSGCTPYCAWTPAGGENGTVIACGRFGDIAHKQQSKIFLSTDLGKTWRTMDNPLVWDYETSSNANYAYSLGFMVDASGAVYHVANAFPDDESLKYQRSHLRVCRFVISSLE